MTQPASSRGTSWPLGQALRHYFSAFLELEDVSAAVREVTDQGANGALPAFVAARAVLASRVRASPEVEAFVLVEEVGLAPDEAAEITELPLPQVERIVAEALSADDEPVSERPAADDGAFADAESMTSTVAVADAGADGGAAVDGDLVHGETSPALPAAEGVDAAHRVTAVDDGPDEALRAGVDNGTGLADPPQDDADVDELLRAAIAFDVPTDDLTVELVPESDVAAVPPSAREEPDAGDLEATEGTDPLASPAPRVELAPGEALLDEDPHVDLDDEEDRVPFGAVALGVAALVILAGIAVVLLQGGGTSLEDTGEVQEAEEVAAVQPQVNLREVVLTDAVVDDTPGVPKDSFAIGEGATLWLAYDVVQPGAELAVVFVREPEAPDLPPTTLAVTTQPLASGESTMTAVLPSLEMARPGQYRAEVQLGGEVLSQVLFSVGA